VDMVTDNAVEISLIVVCRQFVFQIEVAIGVCFVVVAAVPTVSPRRSCAPHEFTCSDGSCIDQQLRCNHNYDCADGSDEFDCGNYQLHCFMHCFTLSD